LDLGIKGKKAIVCASSKGLGLGCAISLAEAGVDLVINSRDPKNLDAAANSRSNIKFSRDSVADIPRRRPEAVCKGEKQFRYSSYKCRWPATWSVERLDTGRFHLGTRCQYVDTNCFNKSCFAWND